MFRGNYKKLSFNGVVNGYAANDTVVFQGNVYKCLIPTSNSPIQESKKWEYIGNSIIYSSEYPPIKPEIGQLWEKNGIVYTYFYDGNNYSWVQL